MFKFVQGIAMLLIFTIPKMESVEILVDGKSLDDDCLRCICVASSECDDHVRCHTEGQDEYYCGPFQISRDYWTASGAPGSDPKNPMDFEECTNNIHCAIKTVNQYLKLKQEDCDRDGLITCQDYALIHKFGPNKCMEKELYEKSTFWTRFDNCFSRENTTFSA